MELQTRYTGLIWFNVKKPYQNQASNKYIYTFKNFICAHKNNFCMTYKKSWLLGKKSVLFSLASLNCQNKIAF